MPGYGDPPKEFQFSSTNQPDPSKKRVPKYKIHLKKFIRENWKIFEDKMKEGNFNFWNLAFERAFGKEKDQIEHSGSISSNIDESKINEKINELLNLRNKDKSEKE